MITAVRRKSDGLLEDIQQVSIRRSEVVIDPTPRIRNAQAVAGGSATDWHLVIADDDLIIKPGFAVYATVDEAGTIQSVTYGDAIDIPPEEEPEVTLEELKARVAELQRLIEQMK